MTLSKEQAVSAVGGIVSFAFNGRETVCAQPKKGNVFFLGRSCKLSLSLNKNLDTGAYSKKPLQGVTGAG